MEAAHMRLLATALVLASAHAAAAQDHSHCLASDAHRGAVDHRHDQATGVAHQASVHHFRIADDGGSILLEATDASDAATRDQIRAHLRTIADAFTAGDFATPRSIHAQAPPGTDVMAERRAAIRYAFEPTERGGRVTIATHDPEALRAVHAFLRFQIDDHGTGDPTE
jgi:hypothetical protein